MKRTLFIMAILISIGVANARPVVHYTKLAVDSVYICVSKTGHKYHDNRECRGLAKCTHEIRKVSGAQASKLGYTACKICYK